MKEAAANDPAVAARVQHFLLRCPEELCDFRADPDALRNLVADPNSAPQLKRLRARLVRRLREIRDPEAGRFTGR